MNNRKISTVEMKTTMKRVTLTAFAFLLTTLTPAFADQTTESIQRTLKEQGFYYGEATGKMDADTTAAIRRYQIRNGLKVTGEVDNETAKSLGVAGGSAPKPVARTQPTPAPAATPETNDLRDEPLSAQTTPPAPRSELVPPPSSSVPYPGYAPGPRGLQPDVSGLFDGTPYEVAPPDIQRRVIIGAQTLLARQGLYRSGIDGVYGPGMQFALRAYQSRSGIDSSGALDMDTLASLGLLPGQRAPGFTPTRRVFRSRSQFAPSGERIFEPY